MSVAAAGNHLALRHLPDLQDLTPLGVYARLVRRIDLVFLALAAVVAVASPACGGKTQTKSAAVAEIKAAVRKSPQTYFAFRNPLYWGRAVQVSIDRIRISNKDDRYAAARVLVLEANGKLAAAPQRVLLKRSEKWQVAQVMATDGGNISCRAASPGVARDLFGSCDSSSAQSSVVALIEGPRADRSPSARERALIIAATKADHPDFLRGSCVRYHVRVSRVDGRFALVGYTFVPPYTNCVLGNGESWMERTSAGRWLVKGDGSDAPDCRWVPPGVARSLASVCYVNRDWAKR